MIDLLYNEHPVYNNAHRRYIQATHTYTHIHTRIHTDIPVYVYGLTHAGH